MPDLSVFFTAVPIVVVVLVLLIIFLSGYVKASPDTAIIISGLRKHPRILVGRAGVKVPFGGPDAEVRELLKVHSDTGVAVAVGAYSGSGKMLRCALGDALSVSLDVSGAAYLKAFLLDARTQCPVAVFRKNL